MAVTDTVALRDELILEVCVLLVAEAFKASPSSIRYTTKASRPLRHIRQTAVYLACVTGELSHTRVADWFGLDRSTVSYALNVVEDRRDDSKFDALLTSLEDRLLKIKVQGAVT